MKSDKKFVFDPKQIRKRLGMNQQEFWGRIGVAQSCGSRYESGRPMPKPVQELLRVVHIERIDLAKVNALDMKVLDYLKADDLEFYQRLRRLIGGLAPQIMVPDCYPVLKSAEPERPLNEISRRELPAVESLAG